MKPCRCERPLLSADPRRVGCCNSCSGYLDPAGEYAATDSNHNAFLDRLELGMWEVEGWPRNEPPPPTWQHFRAMVLQREQKGRPRFGIFGHLVKKNEIEATEEAADYANYLWFRVLKVIRLRGQEDNLDLVLTGCWHAYRAYLVALQLRAKAHGAP